MSIASKETSFVTKVVASVVGLAAGVFMLGLFQVTTAHAQQSNAELRAQIQSLLDTISQLQAQVDGQSGGSAAHLGCSAEFMQDLSMGDRGQQVMQLQKFLNGEGGLVQVAQTGPGSPGSETSYYGNLTAQAVTAFQEKYAAEVLAPVGLSSGTGYWGPSSRSKANAICEASVVADSGDDTSDDLDDILDDGDDSDTGTSTDDDSDEEDEEELSGGEADLTNFDLNSGDDNDVAEGSTAEVAEMEFDVDDGDVRVNRADLTFGADSNNSTSSDTEPWDVFEEVSLMADGDEVASVQVDNEDDWKDDDPLNDDDHSLDNSNDYYQVRLSGLDTVIEEDDTAEMTVQVEAQSNVDDAQNTPTWEVAVLEDGVRARDGEGIDQYTPDTGDSDAVEFDVEEEGQGEGLDVSSSSEDPDESILRVDEDDTSDEYGVFAFDVEAEEGDIAIDTADLNVDFTGNDADGNPADYGDVVNDEYLELDGEQFDADNESYNTDSSTSTLTFDVDEDFTVEEDEEVTAFLFLEFNQQDGNYEDSGVTVQGSLDDMAISGEGADSVDSDGSATGDQHELLTSGIYAEDEADTSASSQDGVGTFEIDVDLTAFEEDVYLGESASTTDDSSISFDYSLSDDNGTTSATVQSDADSAATSSVVLREGNTETFDVTITQDPASSGSYSATLERINFSADGDDADYEEDYMLSPSSDYRTDSVSISGSASN
jgi:hypothetical protein